VFERADRGERVVEQLRGGAQRVAREARQRRGLGAAAGDVTDERQPAAVHLEDVVEVAADPVLVARRAVERCDLPARDLRQATGQQPGLQRVRDVRALRVQPRVLDGRARAPRQLLGERDVGVAESPAGFGADQAERADVVAGGAHRHDQRAAHADAEQQLPVLVVLGDRGEHLVRDLVDDLRRALLDDLGGPRRGVGARGVALADAARERHLVGIDVRDGHRADVPVPVGQADRAPVGELRDRELGDLLERALVVQRRGEQRAGIGQQPLRHLRALDLGEVLADVDDELDASLAVIDARRLRHAPRLLAGRPVHRPQHERLGLELAREQPASRELVQVDRRAVLVRRLVRIDDLLDRCREHLLRVVVAEHSRRGLVGVDQAAARVLDRDGLGELREGGGELRLGRLELRGQAGVVERQRRAAGEHLREVEILLAVAPAGAARHDQRQRPEPLRAGAQRHDQA